MCAQRRDFNMIGLVPCFLVLLFFIGTGFPQITWQKMYGGVGLEKGFSVQQTTDGGYIAVGVTGSYGNGYQAYFIKTDSLGDVLWIKTFGGTDFEQGYSVQQSQDGGFIITGSTNSFGNGWQIYLIKTDSLGDTIWTKNYGGEGSEHGHFVAQTIDGGYFIVGSGRISGIYDPIYLIKTDSLGNVLWTKTHNSGQSRSGQITQDGGYIVAGEILGDSWDFYLVKFDSLGDTVWSHTYGIYGHLEYAYSVQQVHDEGYIIAGLSDYLDSPPYTQIYLVRTDSVGDTIWTKTYGDGAPYSYAYGYYVEETHDHGFIVVGYYGDFVGSVYLVRTDSLGDVLWTKHYGVTTADWGFCVHQTRDRGYIIVGTCMTSDNNEQLYLIKTDSLGYAPAIEERPYFKISSAVPQLSVYPNPFRNHCVIQYALRTMQYTPKEVAGSQNLGQGFSLAIKIYDATGRLVKQFNHLTIQPFNQVVWDGKDDFGRRLPAGVYFCHLEIGETVVATKVVELE